MNIFSKSRRARTLGQTVYKILMTLFRHCLDKIRSSISFLLYQFSIILLQLKLCFLFLPLDHYIFVLSVIKMLQYFSCCCSKSNNISFAINFCYYNLVFQLPLQFMFNPFCSKGFLWRIHDFF